MGEGHSLQDLWAISRYVDCPEWRTLEGFQDGSNRSAEVPLAAVWEAGYREPRADMGSYQRTGAADRDNEEPDAKGTDGWT